MTEAEWMEANHTTPMWWHVEGDPANMRKLRLVACACCRRVWHLMTDRRSKPTIEAAEQLADGFLTQEQVEQIMDRDSGYPRGTPLDEMEGPEIPGGYDDYDVARSALLPIMDVLRAVPSFASTLVERSGGNRIQEWAQQAGIMRDVFGNPFLPVAFNPAWRTSTVVALARGMYDSRDFSPMPLVADALQDTGCDHADILAHCRDVGTHVRGCWVVDLILNKS